MHLGDPRDGQTLLWGCNDRKHHQRFQSEQEFLRATAGRKEADPELSAFAAQGWTRMRIAVQDEKPAFARSSRVLELKRLLGSRQSCVVFSYIISVSEAVHS